MRILMTTRGSAGHVLPLVPVARAALHAGHEVLVATQPAHRANVEAAGLAAAPLADPPPEAWMPLLAEYARQDLRTASERMIGEYFGRVDVEAALPGLRALADRWRPDVVVRDSWEFAGAIVAEERGLPLVRVALGLAEVEELTVRTVAPVLAEHRSAAGLPPDPDAARLRATRYLTAIPAELEDPATPAPSATQRFRGVEASAGAGALPAAKWWPGNDDPLVLLTFGSVAGEPHLPYFPALYRAAIDALAPLPIRLLVTIGRGGDPAALDAPAANVRIERWVPQAAVAPHAAAIVCHGGHGSVLGALAYGVPLVVLPLFSIDQWCNATAVARAGAGIAVAATSDRAVLELPRPAEVEELAAAVARVLGEGGLRARAGEIAAAMAAMPAPAIALEVLADAVAAARAGVPAP